MFQLTEDERKLVEEYARSAIIDGMNLNAYQLGDDDTWLVEYLSDNLDEGRLSLDMALAYFDAHLNRCGYDDGAYQAEVDETIDSTLEVFQRNAQSMVDRGMSREAILSEENLSQYFDPVEFKDVSQPILIFFGGRGIELSRLPGFLYEEFGI